MPGLIMRRYLGYGTLVFFTVLLFVSSLINLFQINLALFVAFFVIVVFAGLAMWQHLLSVRTTPRSYDILSKKMGFDFLATLVGALLTYLLSVNAGLGAVVASGLIGVVGALFIKPYAVPLFCGSFLGMTSPQLLDMSLFIPTAFLVSLIFVLAKDVFNGYGGKLGTIALSSALVISFLTSRTYLDAPIFDDFGMIMIVFTSMGAALLTYVISIRFEMGPVLASGLVGLIAGLILPAVLPVFGVTLAIVAFGASFVGMSAKGKMPEESAIVFAGLLFGLIFIFSAPYFGGAGGKLGTIAFASVLSVNGLRSGLSYFFNRKQQQES